MVRRKGVPIHGWIAFDKPVGMGSTQAVSLIKRITGAQKVGHGGTLDPLASGMLPIALGEATKTVQWAMTGSKTYHLTVRWGLATVTDDAEGAITETHTHRPDPAAILAALPRFTGDILQVPSTYSAVHVDGKRAYDLARAGQTVTLDARPVRVDRFSLIDCPDDDHARFEVVCGKGVYMRSLGRDLARFLGTCAHLSALRRLSVGKFQVDHAISIDQIDDLGHTQGLSEHLLPIETALDDIPALALTETEAQRLRLGQVIRPSLLSDQEHLSHSFCGKTDAVSDIAGFIVCAMVGQKPVALATLENGLLRSMRVLNL